MAVTQVGGGGYMELLMHKCWHESVIDTHMVENETVLSPKADN